MSDTHDEDQIVATFGYQQQLRRGLGLFSLFAVSFSVISITTGIYTNFGFAITNFGRVNNLIVVVAYWLRRDRLAAIPTDFSLGRWATPVFVLAVIWLVGILLDLTLPPIFRPAAVVAIVIWVLAIGWYLLFIRARVNRGEAAAAMRALGVE